MVTIDIGALIIFLLIGAVAGFLAGQIMRGSGFGLVGNIVVGVIGALVGGYLFDLLNIPFLEGVLNGLLGDVIIATIGAIIVLAIINWIQSQ